ncbi:MAG TPA: type II secretion system F family protein [Vicinamibacterales bacterium]|nr:type II secretion system F family protein [Vicinamibacterales bacterium]
MEYRCRLGTSSGHITEGIYVADSEATLRRELEEKGMYVLAIERAGRLPFAGAIRLPQRHKVPARDFLVFNQELATLLKAGMPLVQSLDILRQRVEHPLFKRVLDDVHERVRAGSSLSEAFDAQAGLFPGVYSASLTAGEKSGNLEQVIRRYVAYAKMIAAVKRRTLSALVYPVILTALSLVVVGIIVLKVVPAFAGFYGQFDRELPLSTRVIVAVSGFFVTYFVVIVIAVIAGAAAAWAWLHQPEQRVRFDRFLLRLPFAGAVIQRFSTAQAARTLGTLLGGGIPLVNALEIASRAVGNRYMAHQLQIAGTEVREGSSLAAAMLERGSFPDVAIKMVEVGEQTGALTEMLHSLADFYDEDVETTLGRFVTLVEPILLVTMGLVIAALLLALYMPLFQLSSVMS